MPMVMLVSLTSFFFSSGYGASGIAGGAFCSVGFCSGFLVMTY